jgi:fructoselysine-6-P-deglycase FrlB-like protein
VIILSEPVDYLTEETYRPAWLVDGLTEETLNAIKEKKPELIELGKKLVKAERYYMVGSGGSYSIQLPFVYVAEKYTKVPVHAYSGWDFLERRPEAIDDKAVVILISQGGSTKEVVEALEWCNRKGATTFGLTQAKDSVINKKADISFGWEARGVSFSKLMSLYYLFGSIFKEKGYAVGDKMIKVADGLPEKLPKMIPEAKKTAKKQGLELKDYDKIYVIGGGINWGLTYQFALCTLMEMCWVHGISVNYSEFRHGALEMFKLGTAAIFLRGKSEQRKLEDSIIEFSKDNGVKTVVYDSQEMDVDNLETPFTLFVEVEWLSYYLSLARNRRMGCWRFYDTVNF